MKKIFAFITMLIFVNILSAEGCWGNGVPIYKGNFIYGEHSTITPAGNIYIAWVELDNSYRKLKLQKTNYAGEPIWNEPLTIFQTSDFIIENVVKPNGNDGCFINTTYDNPEHIQELFKIDENGNSVWSLTYHSSSIPTLKPLSNGGIAISQFKRVNGSTYLDCMNVDENGNIMWHNQQLYNFNENCCPKIINEQYIDGFFYFILVNHANSFLLKVNENGEVVSQSENYLIGNSYSSRFIDNNFYIFYKNGETSNVEMYKLDLNGNPVLTESPKIICSSNYLLANGVAFADNYFYIVITNSENQPVFKKCDFGGNVLGTYMSNYDIEYCGLRVYDYDTDFIACSINVGDGQECLIKLTENGLSDPINYLPDGIGVVSTVKYFVNNNFSFVGIKQFSPRKIITMRINGNSTTLHDIKNIEEDLISPSLKAKDSFLYAFWVSDSHKAVMCQKYDEDGTNLYPETGQEIISKTNNFYLTQNKIITVNKNQSEHELLVNCYDFDGELNWSESIAGSIYHYKIYSFNNNYIFVSRNNGLNLMAFDENGFLWNEPTLIPINQALSKILLKGNVLFVRNNHTVSYYHINSDGTYLEPQILATDSNIIYAYGDNDKFLAITSEITFSYLNMFYFENGNLMWNVPWSTNISEAGGFKAFFENDGFYLLGADSSEPIIDVRKYDYDHNPMSEFNCDYTLQNPSLNTFRVIKADDKFVFLIDSNMPTQYHTITCAIVDETGNIILPESSESLLNIHHNPMLSGCILSENNLYFSASYEFKPCEGETQRNYYVQKVDLSGFVNSEDGNIPAFSPQLSNYPNPFNPTTTISFDLPKSGNVDLSIYNIKGQKVKTLTSEKYSKGKHSLIWTGKDDKNQSVASGVYFYRLKSGNFTSTKKMILLK